MTDSITLTPVRDAAGLGRRWRVLEAECQGGVFRSWSWLGTLLPHLREPLLLAVRRGGDDIALAVLARGRPGRLHLHEAGTALWDSLTIEHNGLLHRPGEAACLAPALGAVLAQAQSLTLSGTDEAHAAAAAEAGLAEWHGTRQAPAVDLTALRGRYLDRLSANTRGQLRRAIRLHGGEAALAVRPAASVADGWAVFDALVAHHQEGWTSRGHPGAFASAEIRAFHRALIAEALGRREAALLTIEAAGRPIAYLYQLQHRGHVFAYQAGIPRNADPRAKPGLVAHLLAIEHARAEGARLYDFGAGAQRYKTSLAPGGGGAVLHWLTLHRRGAWAPVLRSAARAGWAALRARRGRKDGP